MPSRPTSVHIFRAAERVREIKKIGSVNMTFELPVVFHSDGVPLVGRFIRNTRAAARDHRHGFVADRQRADGKDLWPAVRRHRIHRLHLRLLWVSREPRPPRQAEIPARKIKDIFAAAAFLRTVGFVDPERIGCVAICASAQYVLRALAQSAPIRAFASVAGWYHDPANADFA
jgi:uncharacterized protein